MKGKECECEALRLVGDMTRAYDTWGKSPATGDKVLGLIASDIKKHLSLQLFYGDYQEEQEPYHSLLAEMRAALKRYDSGEDNGVSAMEVVRDTLHNSDELKQLMVCGPHYRDKESLTETAKVLVRVFTTMSSKTSTPEAESRVIIDEQSKKLGCPERVIYG